MSTNVTLNGTTYAIPAVGDSSWGTVLQNYFIALSTGVLSKAGGTFTMTAEADLGATYGLKMAYLKSRATNPSATGILRLGNTEALSWRNAANGADLPLTVNASNQLTYNGVVLASTTGPSFQDSLFNVFDNSDITKIVQFQCSGITTGTTRTLTVPDENITLIGAASTATFTNKTMSVATNTIAGPPNTVAIFNGSSTMTASSTTDTELGYVAGVTSAIQTQMDLKAPLISPSFTTPNIGSATGTSLSVSGQLTSTVSTGTAPLVVSSTTEVANLKAATATLATTATKSTNLVGGNGTTLLGSIPYQSGTDTTTQLAPNTTTTKKFLRETGDGTNGTAPAWDTIVDGDVANSIVIGKVLTGYSSAAGTVASTDTILQAFNKINGNVVALSSPTLTYTAQTGTYSAAIGDYVDATSNTFTVTLPTAVSQTGKSITVKNSGTGIITIATTSSQTIDGLASGLKLATRYELLNVVSDGANWKIAVHDYNKDWTSFTPTGSWTGGNVSYTGKWRRVGSSMEVTGAISLIGAPTGTTLTITLPNSETIATAKLSSTTINQVLGISSMYAAGVTSYAGAVGYSSTTVVGILVYKSDATYTSNATVTNSVPGTFQNGDYVNFSFSVPITNWW